MTERLGKAKQYRGKTKPGFLGEEHGQQIKLIEKRHVDNHRRVGIHRIAVRLFTLKEPAVELSRKGARETIFLKLMHEHRHQVQSRKQVWAG